MRNYLIVSRIGSGVFRGPLRIVRRFYVNCLESGRLKELLDTRDKKLVLLRFKLTGTFQIGFESKYETWRRSNNGQKDGHYIKALSFTFLILERLACSSLMCHANFHRDFMLDTRQGDICFMKLDNKLCILYYNSSKICHLSYDRDFMLQTKRKEICVVFNLNA